MKLVMDHGTSTVSQILALRLLEDLNRILEERRALVRERRAMLESLLREHVPTWTWETPAGGLSLWVRLPAGDAMSFAQVATRHGVTLVPGPMTSVDGNFADRVRLPFVLDPDTMREGVERLGRAWAEYEPEVGTGSRAVRVVV
jgi:DNA-binding transcriptional MocR family regulator